MKVCNPTPEENRALEVARVGLMAAAPFYSHLYFSTLKEVLTRDIPTLATDGASVFINPAYLAGLKPPEAVFALAHEVVHFVSRHCQRARHYAGVGKVRNTPFDMEQLNYNADYVVNAGLMEEGVGLMNPAWLYDQNVTGEHLVEDVYERNYKKPPPGGNKGGGGQGKGSGQGNAPSPPGKTYAGSGKAPRGAQQDKVAAAQGGGFDTLLPPPVNPVTGAEEAPDEGEFKEAVARAFAAAKAMGNVHGNVKRLVEAILEPQVDWREHVRLLLTGKMGARSETWDRPNRRRLVLNPLVIMPGRRGFGADTVVVGVDTSGSIGDDELGTFFAEVGGVLSDIRPKKVILIFCDAKVQRVDEAASLDELADIRVRGAPGGGGTNFIPVFEWVKEQGIVPDTLIYLTDLYGRFPSRAPAYPVVWCATTDQPVPFGDVVRIKV